MGFGEIASFAGVLLMGLTTVNSDPLSLPFSVLPLKWAVFWGGENSSFPVLWNNIGEPCSISVPPVGGWDPGFPESISLTWELLVFNAHPGFPLGSVLLPRRWALRGGAASPGPSFFS